MRKTINTSRFLSLDLLRGLAILGILILNITSFSQIFISYVNPTLGAGIEGINAYIHGFAFLFADMRFMNIFAILFGAGIVLFIQSAERKGYSVRKYHYKRMFLLLLFGLIHAYLIWMGDILTMYALAGSIVYGMRNWSSKKQLITACILFFVPLLFSWSAYGFLPMSELQEIYKEWQPSTEVIAAEVAAYQGDYWGQMPFRIKSAIQIQTTIIFFEQAWKGVAMMLLGVVLFKNGFLLAQQSKAQYRKIILLTFPIGLVLAAISLYSNYSHDWNGVWVMTIGHSINYIASVFLSVAYIAIVMYWYLQASMLSLQQRLVSIGQLAFSSYIFMSLVCTLFFYGHGLGYFAQLDRLEQWGIILIVWALLLFLAPWLKKRYKQGPLEYLWRRGTYGAKGK